MPTHLSAHLHFCQDTITDKKCKSATTQSLKGTATLTQKTFESQESPAGKSTLGKVGVQCFYESEVLN